MVEKMPQFEKLPQSDPSFSNAVTDQPAIDSSPVLAVMVVETGEGQESEQKSKTTHAIVIYCSSTRWAIFALAVAGIIASAIGLILVLREGLSSSDAGKSSYVFPFEERVPLLSEKVLRGYDNVEEFEADLWKVAESYVNIVVVGYQLGLGSHSSVGMVPNQNIVPQAVPMQSTTVSTPRAEMPVGDHVNDFGTNNQESGVNEGDTVVTDGKIVAAAYGQFIVFGNVTDGTLLLKMELDPTEETGKARPEVYVHTLILRDNLLVVAARGYGYNAQQAKQRVLFAYGETRVLVYDIKSTGKNNITLDLVAKRDINGRFETTRSVGESIHFVMSNELDLNTFLFQPLSPYDKYFDGLDIEGYAKQVRRIASETTIPNFVKHVSNEILECGELPRMLRLNRWTTQDTSDTASAIEHFLYAYGYARSWMTIVSFNLNEVRTGHPDALQCLSIAGSFFPAAPWGINVYAAPETMLMAVRGYDFNTSRDSFIDSTYLVAYDLDGVSANPKALGNVGGHVINQYSFRVDGSVLQLATTIEHQWTWLRTGPQWRRLSVMNVPITENWVITMDLEGEKGKMIELDRLKLGKGGEVFTSVRFYGDKAYAVTFRRMDPFYILNTSNPHDLRISGELDNITGWSSYLEPMNSDQSVLLAIGQEADEEGRTLGLSISVFDARDLDNVKVAARLLIESSTDVWSDSEGLHNKNAIRFNAKTGRLILPLLVSGSSVEDNFRGFRVFLVRFDSIVEEAHCMVDMTDFYGPYAHPWPSLDLRSMIIRGSFMSTMGNHVVMKDLDTCITEWQIKL